MGLCSVISWDQSNANRAIERKWITRVKCVEPTAETKSNPSRIDPRLITYTPGNRAEYSNMSLRMSFLGCLLVATTILVLQAQANVETNEVDQPDTYMLQGVHVYPNDRQCVLVGGLCVKTDDCIEPTSNKGLCPSSAGLGVECCYELRSRSHYLHP